MKFIFYSHGTFEHWDWTNPDTQGIGGSETSHIEMSWRLARRGHSVRSYSPTGWPDVRTWRNVVWSSYEGVDFNEGGIWVFYRCPSELDKIERSPGKQIWMVCQDVWYDDWTEERAAKVDKVICLCMEHCIYTARNHPYLAGKIVQSSNGIKTDLIEEVLAEGIKRNPLKMIYTSSPDRGLEQLASIYRRAKDWVPGLELHIYYGWNNVDKIIAMDPRHAYMQRVKDRIIDMLKVPGVVWHGRTAQKELTREWASSGIWCYPVNFTETSCISSMEAQALGAIPVTSNIWALGENVMFGAALSGDTKDAYTQTRYVAEVVRLAKHPEIQEQLRPEMMFEAKCRFAWDRFVDQWEGWALDVPASVNFTRQFAFQAKNIRGKTLNVGCDIDGGNLKSLPEVTNMDVNAKNPWGLPLPIDVQGDIRSLPQELVGKFDTVILGDILEHMTREDAVQSIRQAKTALRNGGQVVMTVPNDKRSKAEQNPDLPENGWYTEGVSHFHVRPIPEEEVKGMVEEAGLHTVECQVIDYGFFKGWGVIANG